MNQSDIISAPVGTGAATIRECSNTPATKIPHLTVMLPFELGYDGHKDEPASSIMLGDKGTRDLYQFLHSYFTAEACEPQPTIQGLMKRYPLP